MFSSFWLSVPLHRPKPFFLLLLPLYLAECHSVVKFLWAVGIFRRTHVLSTSLCSAVTQPVLWEENMSCFCRQCCRHLWCGADSGQFKRAVANKECMLQDTWSMHFVLFNIVECWLLLSRHWYSFLLLFFLC